MDIKTFKDFKSLAEEFVEICMQVNMEKGDADIALSGGSAIELYKELAKNKEFFTEELTLWQVDERFVPLKHEHSNAGKILNAFGKYESILNFNYFDTEIIENPATEAEKLRAINLATNGYEQSLVEYNEDFELTILGIGPDGHIASLFPHSSALDEETRLVANTQTEEFDVKDRLTITYPMILRSKQILVVIQGESKKNLVDKIREDKIDFHKFPANKLNEHSNVTLLFGEW